MQKRIRNKFRKRNHKMEEKMIYSNTTLKSQDFELSFGKLTAIQMGE